MRRAAFDVLTPTSIKSCCVPVCKRPDVDARPHLELRELFLDAYSTNLAAIRGMWLASICGSNQHSPVDLPRDIQGPPCRPASNRKQEKTIRFMTALLLLCMALLTGCEHKRGSSAPALPNDPSLTANPAGHAILPKASGGLRGALEAECGVEIPAPDDLITIVNARLGQSSFTTAERFCSLAATQHPVGATGLVQAITVALPNGTSVTVNRTAN